MMNRKLYYSWRGRDGKVKTGILKGVDDRWLKIELPDKEQWIVPEWEITEVTVK